MHMPLFLKNIFKNTNLKKGQTTLLMVLMVMVVSLGVGLAVSQRTATNIRKTTNVKQTDQAFSCAQSAVEVALKCIKDKESSSQDPTSCSASNQYISGDTTNCNYSYTVENYKASSGSLEFKLLPKDAVQQLKTTGVDSLTVKWKPLDSSSTSGVEVTEAYKTSSSNYSMEKNFFWCGSSPANITGFTEINANGSGYCEKTISLNGGALESLVRIRSYGGDINLTVSSSDNDFNNIVQGYLITSSGRAGQVERTVKVARMNPQLPAVFDYVLYSEEGSITK